MASRNVTGTILKADGTPWASATVTFRLRRGSYSSTEQHPPSSTTATTDEEGTFTKALWCNDEGLLPAYYTCILPGHDAFAFYLEAGEEDISLSALRDQQI